MKTPQNPFILSGYAGKEWFCNREKELAGLLGHIENERNVVLYAWRRLGKTALIKCLFDKLERTREMEAVYVDLFATQSVTEALEAITTAIYEKYGRTSSGLSSALQTLLSSIGVSIRFNEVTGAPEISFGLRQPPRPEPSLAAIGKFLSNRKKNVVIALDEFQQLSSYEDKHREALFRNWMQEFPPIRFIYSGSHRKLMYSMFSEKNRPFYQSSQLMSIDPIHEDDYSAFIIEHFKKNGKMMTTDMTRKIYQWCRGQTYSIQRVCNYLFGHYDHPAPGKLTEVFEQIIEQDKPMFASYQKMLTRSQWSVLKAIAAGEPLKNPLSKEFLKKYSLGAASSVQTALQALQKKEIVVEEHGSYFVHDVILARWLQTIA